MAWRGAKAPHSELHLPASWQHIRRAASKCTSVDLICILTLCTANCTACDGHTAVLDTPRMTSALTEQGLTRADDFTYSSHYQGGCKSRAFAASAGAQQRSAAAAVRPAARPPRRSCHGISHLVTVRQAPLSPVLCDTDVDQNDRGDHCLIHFRREPPIQTTASSSCHGS